MSETIQRIDETAGLLRSVDGDVGEFVQEMFDAVLRKNEGLAVLRKMSCILQNEGDTVPGGCCGGNCSVQVWACS